MLMTYLISIVYVLDPRCLTSVMTMEIDQPLLGHLQHIYVS